MICEDIQPSLPAEPIKDPERDARSGSLRKALLVPAAMFLFLASVPLLRTHAGYLFVALFVPMILWASIADTELAIYLYIAWCWMDGTIRGVLGGGTIITLGRDIVLAIVLAGWCLQRLVSRDRDPVRLPPATLLLVLFAVNCLIQITNPYSLGALNTLAGLKAQLSAIPIYFIAFDVFRRREQVRSLAIFLTLACLAISFVALLQYSHGKTWTFAHFPGTENVIMTSMRNQGISPAEADKILFRPPGTTLIGGATGVFISLVFPLTFALMLLGDRLRFSNLVRALFGVCSFVFLVTIFLGGLRIGVVQAIEGIVFCAFLCGGRIRARAILATAAVILLGVIGLAFTANISHGAISNRYASLFSDPVEALHQDRKTFFEQLPDLAVNSPMGVGLGRTGAAAGYLGGAGDDLGFVAFSESYLGVEILETGLIGAILMACIAVTFLLVGFAALRRVEDSDDKLLVAALISILMMIFVDFFAMSVLSQPPGSVLFWLLAAVLARVYAATPSKTGSSNQQPIYTLQSTRGR